jgi:heme o synthase
MATMDLSNPALAGWRYRSGQYIALTKPRITLMAVFCALIGMLLASKTLPPLGLLFTASLGIGLLAAAGFTVNCLVERRIDAQMARTRARPMARGEVNAIPATIFALVVGGIGAWILLAFVNALTMWLTLATFVGYAIIYTLVLKPATPQNIVIGGASGAMPPLLGWVAITNEVNAPAVLMVLIIFLWTPPHFWVLALYRIEDYKRSGLPMLPVTHGPEFTRLNVWLYTVLMVVSTVLPFVIGMSGLLYLTCAMALGGVFLYYAWAVWKHYTDKVARTTFWYSILYLGLLFAALLVDHYVCAVFGDSLNVMCRS